jgi:hypothetical protein
VLPIGPVHPFTVALTEYVPEAFTAAFGIVGFCDEELNPPGPVHEYDAALIAPAESDKELPTHKGPLFEARGAKGRGLTTASVDAGELAQPFTVAVTLYAPPFATPALLITGF